MKKKIISAIIIATLAVSMTACGGSTDSERVAELEAQIEELQQQLEEAKQGQTGASDSDSETQSLINSINAETAEYQGICGADAKWYYKDNVLVIKGTGEITDNPWQSVEYRVDGKYSERIFKINWVIIDEGITVLGDGSFEVAGDVAKVILPSSLYKIGNECFRACHSLSSINISDSITEIGVDAFDSCDLLDASTLEKITAINPDAYNYPSEGVGVDTGM